MSHKITGLFGVLVLGLLLGGYLTSRVEGQMTTSALSLNRCCWPPKPQDIVNVALENVHLDPLTIPVATLFTVPANKYFVLTDAAFIGGTTFNFVQELSGVFTVKLPNAFLSPFHSPVGLVFAPGSNVALQVFGVTPGDSKVLLTGYLANP